MFDDDYDSDSEGEDIVLDDDDDDGQVKDQNKNDDDDEDDMYDDEEDIVKSNKNSDSLRLDFIDNSRINNDKKSSDDDDESPLFSLRRKTANKLGSNDAIKIISTPHGKVGIVYQSNDASGDLSKKGSNESIDKSRKVTPVLTPDGKVALLYRGASGGSTKYEPIQNLTNNEFMTKIQDNKTSSITNFADEETTEQQPITVVPDTTTATMSTTTVRFGNVNEPSEEENSILPNINRPLSEVLGIKKNQFTQFRITDRSPTATPSLSGQKSGVSSTTSNKVPEMPNYDYDYGEGEVENDVLFGGSNKETVTESPLHRVEDTIQPTTISDVLSKTEVINLAIIPAFESDLQLIQQQELEQQQQHSNHHRKHHRHRHRHLQDLTAIHCAMQAMVAIAAMATIFGMLGAYFKTRILDQIQIMHW